MSDSYLYRSLEAYIRKHYIEEEKLLFRECCFMTEPEEDTEESFSEMLLRKITESGMTEVQCYKKANIDRKLFSKLRKNDYHPSKKTVIALALALQLNLDEATDLLRYAEYALSPNDKADVIISFCFTKPVYDIFTVNELLYKYAGTSL